MNEQNICKINETFVKEHENTWNVFNELWMYIMF